MSAGSDRFVVITGGPGSGKSTLLEALRRAGWRTSDEVGRRIIKEQVAISGRALPWVDPQLFAEMMLSWEMRSYAAAQSERSGTVFFDRGIPDVLGYLSLVGLPIPPHVRKAASLFRYNRRVFVAPHWPEIFAQDRERKQTQEEAERTHNAMVATYTACGYELLEIPRESVEARVRFILESGVAAAG
jgi:predicted ATPase